MPDVLRALAATLLLFGVGGFGLVRLLLPAPLRRHELLWVLPAGGCAVGWTHVRQAAPQPFFPFHSTLQ